MTKFLWGVYPYICIMLFFAVPPLRMSFRPFSWSTRASGLFNRQVLGMASLLLHWGLLLVLAGHLAGLFGGLLASDAAMAFFYWSALIGGFMVLGGSVVALYRRVAVSEVRAMSQPDDYLVHVFFIPIVGLALYQVLVHRIFGVAYTAAAWTASLWTLSPQPELMASASLISKLHVFLALTFLAYFPFTKLVHVWTFPINYFVRPYQSMRTLRYRFMRRWELALRSDKSWLVYGLAIVAVTFLVAGSLLGRAHPASATTEVTAPVSDRLMGWPLYVSQCARCHGTRGTGDGPGADSPTFAAAPRDLTAGRYRFVSTANGVASDEDLARTIRHGLRRAGMPAFAELTDAQVRSLVGVLNHLWVDRPAAGAAIDVPLPPRPTSRVLARGRTVYEQFCAMCHGLQGHGDGPAAANLPTTPADLAAGKVKAGSEFEQLYLRVAAGIPPLMPAFQTTLSPEDVRAVAWYVETEVLRQP